MKRDSSHGEHPALSDKSSVRERLAFSLASSAVLAFRLSIVLGAFWLLFASTTVWVIMWTVVPLAALIFFFREMLAGLRMVRQQ